MIPDPTAAVLSMLKNGAENIFQSVYSILKLDMSLDEVANMYSQKMDEIVISEIVKGYMYADGRLSLKYLDDSKFEVLYELWFIKGEDWFKRDNHSAPIETKYLAKDALAELRRELFVSWTIEPPKQEKIDAVLADAPELAKNLNRR